MEAISATRTGMQCLQSIVAVCIVKVKHDAPSTLTLITRFLDVRHADPHPNQFVHHRSTRSTTWSLMTSTELAASMIAAQKLVAIALTQR